ncbi:T9SS type A sorting domain-containing protein [Neolewinella antarctica]|uniref:Subtilisin-like proprotein convertase family protein n=1 Tax=Neolewinella antarctica TaxID=442734 RepID=A0ABX0XD65_9BACT|nr:trypsin-like peptidase domain-containing protein [Neolewinella antarctica]NJC27147.1 subtilisin-like proprotein convertase family protein [Neolewinella antarctica]
MTRFSHALILLLSLSLCTSVRAQHSFPPGFLQKLEAPVLPQQDNDRLRRQEIAARKPGRVNTFAVTIPQTLRPSNSGTWVERRDTSIWYLRVTSPGAKTLNLGFSEYKLPAGAELYLTTTTEKFGPFTPADNAEHNQLWTPVVTGDDLIVELRVPTRQKDLVRLYLTSVNHDFIDVTKALSGSCNLDVACGAADGWPVVDQFRNVIRSVAAYTLNGRNQCTGFLVNNTNEDGTPFFMTANHCEVTKQNAETVVAYWNFQSPVCRQPGSPASGGDNRGSRNVFNRGATLLARAASTDFALLLLDEPVNPAADAFYAGWSREQEAPSGTTVSVHHPSVDDKRIAVTYGTVRRVKDNPDIPDRNGSYLRVNQWDIGTTERGSSGAPLFDENSRVRGQLWRGAANCDTPTGFDQFGYFTASWEGDGTPASRLKDWLDPCGKDPLVLDGFEDSDLPFTLTTASNCLDNCVGELTTFSVLVPGGYPAASQVTIVASSSGIDPALSTTTVGGGEEIQLTVPGNPSRATGTYVVTLRVAGGGRSDDIDLTLNLFRSVPATPTLVGPANEAPEVSPLTTFSWSPVAETENYDLQVSVSPAFNASLIDERVKGTTIYENTTALPGDRTYYWRVRANNVCGSGEWTEASFTVANQLCARAAYAGNPVPIDDNTVSATVNITEDVTIDNLEIFIRVDHTYIGDLFGSLTSPGGTVVELFTGPGNGGCSFDNLTVTFVDDAPNTAADFASTCTNNNPSISGIYQPLAAFSALGGTNARGRWTLTIDDRGEGDAGEILEFRLDVCARANAASDFSVRPAEATWEACLDGAATFDLALGTSYDATTTVSISAGDVSLTEFSTEIRLAERTATLNFTGWNDLPAGNTDLTVEVTASNGNLRFFNIPLTLSQAAAPAVLLSPSANERVLKDEEVTFSWLRPIGAEDFTLEYSLAADFVAVIGREETTFTELSVADLPVGQPIYWRVIGNNEICGSVKSEVGTFTVVNDYSVRANNTNWRACLEGETSFALTLGASYDENTSVTVSAGGVPITEFATALDIANRTATLKFTGWNGLPAGETNVIVAVTAADDSLRSVSVPLTLVEVAGPATLLSPAADAELTTGGGITFEWLRPAGAESFTLEYSLDAEFTVVAGQQETDATEIIVSTIPVGQPVYWRVVSNNGVCGPAVSATRVFTINSDFSVRAATSTWEACLGDTANFDLTLGSGYDENTSVAISAGDVVLTEFSTILDLENRTATIGFTGWNELPVGRTELTVVVTASDSSLHTLLIPLTLGQAAGPATLLSPTADAELLAGSDITFTWLRPVGTDSFTLEYSLDADFATIAGQKQTDTTEIMLESIPAGQPVYWRVISNNEACGSAVSDVRTFTLQSTAVGDFGDDRSVAIYPNPVRGAVNVELRGNWSERVMGTLHDATGRVLRDYQIERAGLSRWDVSGLPEGLYFLRVRSGGRQFTERIIVGR